MRAEDPQGRSPASVMSGADSLKKNSNDALLMNGPRGGGNNLSRAQASNSTRKQLQYYDSTPQQPRKHASVLKKQMVSS